MLHPRPWVVAPPWPDHLFPMAEGQCCPVCGRTKLRGAPRMDERRANERLAGRTRFFLFSPPFFSFPFAAFCQIDDVRGKYYLFSFHCWFCLCLLSPAVSILDDGTERWSPSRKPTLMFALLPPLKLQLLLIIVPFLLGLAQLLRLRWDCGYRCIKKNFMSSPVNIVSISRPPYIFKKSFHFNVEQQPSSTLHIHNYKSYPTKLKHPNYILDQTPRSCFSKLGLLNCQICCSATRA